MLQVVEDVYHPALIRGYCTAEAENVDLSDQQLTDAHMPLLEQYLPRCRTATQLCVTTNAEAERSFGDARLRAGTCPTTSSPPCRRASGSSRH